MPSPIFKVPSSITYQVPVYIDLDTELQLVNTSLKRVKRPQYRFVVSRSSCPTHQFHNRPLKPPTSNEITEASSSKFQWHTMCSDNRRLPLQSLSREPPRTKCTLPEPWTDQGFLAWRCMGPSYLRPLKSGAQLGSPALGNFKKFEVEQQRKKH